MKIVMSSGHGLYVRGAADILDEVNEARRVVDKVAEYLRQLNVEVDVFHENSAHNRGANLSAIVRHHNAQNRELDISIHFNAASRTTSARGVEVLYYDERAKAEALSAAIAKAGGFKDRGAKQRKELYFLGNTDKPALLIEVCFVDSVADAELYNANFDAICRAIAENLSGKAFVTSAKIPEIKEDEEIMTQKFEPPNQAIRDAVSTVLLRFEQKDPALAAAWRDKANRGELTLNEAVGLLFVAIERGYITGI